MPTTRSTQYWESAEGNGAILLSFDKPIANVWPQLESILRSMSISAHRPPLPGFLESADVDWRGTLADVLGAFRHLLEQDSSNLSADAMEGDSFKYEVASLLRDENCIELDTVLSCQDNPGTIRYGRVVRRVAINEYWVWVDG